MMHWNRPTRRKVVSNPAHPVGRPSTWLVARPALLMLVAVPLLTACPETSKQPDTTIHSVAVTPAEVVKGFGQFTISWSTSNTTTSHACHLEVWAPAATSGDITDLGEVHCNDFTTHTPERPGEYQYILSIRERSSSKILNREPSAIIKYLAPDPGTELWTRQFGTSSYERAGAVATDTDGNVIVAGYTFGSLAQVNQGSANAFVRKYGPNGDHLWTQQFGANAETVATAVATDGEGNIIVAGSTAGALDGTSHGGADGYVRKYAPNGAPLWTQQFGTGADDYVAAVATDDEGNIVVAGYTLGSLQGANQGEFDAYVRKYGPNGDYRWTEQFGTNTDDHAFAVTTDDEGNIMVAGSTSGPLQGANQGGYDAYVRKYGPSGDYRWTRQFGTTGIDEATAVATDTEGAIIVAGSTWGALFGANQGESDAFVLKLGPTGGDIWSVQYGTGSYEEALAVTTDRERNIIVAGSTEGSLDAGNQGSVDGHVRKYAPNRDHLWSRQFGTDASDISPAVTTDGEGNVIVAGNTRGSLQGPNQGDSDAFVRKYSP